jgi:integrase/recombinase XerD
MSNSPHLSQQHLSVLATADELSPMRKILDQYCTYLAARNYSPYTIEQRRSTMENFIAWLGSHGTRLLRDVTPALVETYRFRLFNHRKVNGEPLSLRTQAVRLVALRAFFRWLARERIIPNNPAVDLELPRSERRLPRTILSEQEVEAVLALPDISTPLGLRDRAIMEILYVTGIRRLELTRLRLRDVDHGRGMILVRKGKGARDRFVPTGERVLAWLAAYQRWSRPRLVGDKQSDMLFVTSRGTSLQPKKLTDRVSAYISAAKLDKKGSCHLFRHAAATLMLENGADIRFIQAMLGHESLDTTRIYTHVSIGPLAAVHEATHPGATFKDDAGRPPDAPDAA